MSSNSNSALNDFDAGNSYCARNRRNTNCFISALNKFQWTVCTLCNVKHRRWCERDLPRTFTSSFEAFKRQVIILHKRSSSLLTFDDDKKSEIFYAHRHNVCYTNSRESCETLTETAADRGGEAFWSFVGFVQENVTWIMTWMKLLRWSCWALIRVED